MAEAGSPRSNLGIEWDEPREFSEIRVSLREEVPADGLEAEYWVSSWPAPEGRGGWTLTDSPFIGKWVRIHTDRGSEGGEMVLRFRPLSAEENPNARSRAGWVSPCTEIPDNWPEGNFVALNRTKTPICTQTPDKINGDMGRSLGSHCCAISQSEDASNLCT